MKWVFLAFLSVALISVVPPALAKLTPEQLAQLPAPARRPVSFSKDIKPVLEARCVNCHGHGRTKGGFQIDTRETFLKGGDSGPAVILSKSAESYLVELVSGVDPDNVMPKKGSRLTVEQISLVRAWIDQGLPWDEGVTFARTEPRNLQPRRPELPPASGDATHPVDRLLTPYFASNHIRWPEPVSDRLFARRVHLDVIGLPPSPAELKAFLDDKSVNKRVDIAKKLLNDKQRYAEHWLTFWNDLLRNDYRGTGYIDGGRKQISAWLFTSLVNNVPYDKFVEELINPGPASEGFVKGIVWRGVVNASQTPQMQAAQNISQVFMGVNLKCASCHDSFINDWKLSDAYGLANIYADEPLEMFECDKPTGKKASVQFIYPTLGSIDPAAKKEERLKQFAQLITRKEDGRLPRTMVNRLWAKFFGRGLVEPLDDMEQPAWNRDLLDWLAEDLVEHDYDVKHTIARILTSRAYQLPSVDLQEQAAADYVFKGPAVRRMTAEQFSDAVAALGGVWHDKPAGEFDFSCLRGDSNEKVSGKWIWNEASAASKAPPGRIYLRKRFTLARVPQEAPAVIACDNSFTLYCNGKNVASGKDYTKPATVDLRPHLREGENVLAAEAINNTTENKPPSEPADAASANPAGFFLSARFPHSADSRSWGSDASWLLSTKKVEGWNKVDFDDAEWSRAAELGDASVAPWSLQQKFAQAFSANMVKGKVRASMVAADPLMIALGRPNREQVATSRPVTATTLQMLELTNGRKLAESLHNAAGKLVDSKPPAGLAENLFLHALGRPPATKELALAQELVGSPPQAEGTEDLLWSLVMLPEFQLIY